MKIAILGSRGYPSTYGGFETFVRHIAPWLVARGHEVTVYGRGSARAWEREIDGIRVVGTRGFHTKSTSTASHGITAALHCIRTRPDVVLALNVANGPAVPLLRARGIPVAMNVDGIEWKRAKWGWFARSGFRAGAWLSARFANAVVADSREIARIWRDDHGVDATFIPYGADVSEAVGHHRVLEGGLEPGKYVLAVARLVPENNVELLLDAMESLDWAFPTVIVGSANYQNPIEARLRALVEDGRIAWLGHVDDPQLLAELWANAAVYFHGHSVGGTNPALLSALGYGAPTVAVDTPFNREVAGAEPLVQATTLAVADAIAALYVDEAEQARRSAAGRSAIARSYLWESCLEQYEALLHHLASHGS